MGSSLRVRGAASIVGGALQGVGIIPAHAGSSILNAGTVELGRDHPRACGEQRSAEFLAPWSPGSSPRVRGAVRVHRRNERRPGIIPACAGSRLGGRCPVGPERDHPRAGGEQAFSKENIDFGAGSSPRVRGAVRDRYDLDAYNGIIPARAGSSVSPDPSSLEWGDHPRACGEQSAVSRIIRSNLGSSPRVRGAVAVYRPR